jgi:hypothetical protein
MRMRRAHIARWKPAFRETPTAYSLSFSLSASRDSARLQPPIILALMEGGGEKGKGKIGNNNGASSVHEPVGVHT